MDTRAFKLPALLLLHDWAQATGKLTAFERKILRDTAIALLGERDLDPARAEHVRQIFHVAIQSGFLPGARR